MKIPVWLTTYRTDLEPALHESQLSLYAHCNSDQKYPDLLRIGSIVLGLETKRGVLFSVAIGRKAALKLVAYLVVAMLRGDSAQRGEEG